MTTSATEPRTEPADRPTLPAILTPCHDEPLTIATTWKGVVDEISCGSPGCPNIWNPDGTVMLDRESTR